jgi:LacI family transcriptional regulator
VSQATLRDVSREAGVSLATADRVLNHRPGVRQVTVQRVMDASVRLGYQANPFATRLARGDSFRLIFVLPDGTNPFMRGLAEHVTRLDPFLARQRTAVELRTVPQFKPAKLAAALDGLGDAYHGVGVVALDHPRVRAAIDRLADRGVAVVTLVSDAPDSRRLSYVGVDNIAAGRTAGSLLGRMSGGRAGALGVIVGSSDLRDHSDRLAGCTTVLAAEYPHLRVQPPRYGLDDDAACAAVTREMLEAVPDLRGIYVAGAGTVGAAQALHAAGRGGDVLLVGHELVDTARTWLRNGTIDALINQDAGHEARSAARQMLARLTHEPILPDQERIRIEIFLRDNAP